MMNNVKCKIQVLNADQSLLCVDVNHERCVVGGELGGLVILDGLKSTPQVVSKVTVDANNDISSACIGEPEPHNVFCSVGREVYKFDVRNLSSCVHRFSYNSDEVNHILVSEGGKYLLSADDSGQIKVVNLRDNSLKTTLKKHSGVCYALQKRPLKNAEIISGGYDCCCIRWDLNRMRLLQNFDINTMTLNNRIPFVNPPYVLCLDFSVEGGILAAGLQDGNIQLWDSSQDRLHATELMCSAHSSLGVTQVKFVNGAISSTALLLTGGNDGLLKAWDVVANCESPKYNLNHGSKINCLTLSENADLLVCDVTSYLTLYDVARFC